MNFYGISNLLTGIISLVLGVFVYVKGYKYRLVRRWSAFALSAAFYGFGAAMVSVSKDATEAMFWWKIAYIGVLSLPFLFVLLVYEFIGIKRPVLTKIFASITACYFILNFIFPKILIPRLYLYYRDIKFVKPLYFAYPSSPLLVFFIISVFFGWVFYAHLELINHYKKADSFKRNQIKYFFLGAALGFTGGGTSWFPCLGINIYPYLNFTVPLYFIIICYAIFRHRLMDIKVAITRTGIFIGVYAFLLGIPFALFHYFKAELNAVMGPDYWMALPVLLIVPAIFGPFIYIYVERRAERRLLYEQYRYRETLNQAAREMARIHNLKKLLSLIVHTVTKTVRISRAAIYLFDIKEGQFSRRESRNIHKGQPDLIDKNSPLVNWLEEHREPLICEEITRREEGSALIFKGLEAQIRSLGAVVIVPGFLDQRLIGILVLGQKRSGKIYTSEDLSTFSLLANQATLAIENALLYENMEDQVKLRTKELVDVQKQLIQAEKLATVGTLAGGVAHEINNPLTAVLTNVQMLLATTATGNMDRESLELIEEATKRCRTIVQKLMTYARKPLESSGVTKVDLAEVINKAVSFLNYQLGQDNVRVVCSIDESKYLVMGNENELEQVLTNLILNARDAIRKIKTGGDIHISLLQEDRLIKIKIKDDGAGIAKEISAKIFDPFFTTKDVGKGLGLGLSICQSIIEKHRGKISVISEPGQGAEFTIQLPRA